MLNDAECHYAECRYADCHGAVIGRVTAVISFIVHALKFF
jgi:hypothetical protein